MGDVRGVGVAADGAEARPDDPLPGKTVREDHREVVRLVESEEVPVRIGGLARVVAPEGARPRVGDPAEELPREILAEEKLRPDRLAPPLVREARSAVAGAGVVNARDHATERLVERGRLEAAPPRERLLDADGVVSGTVGDERGVAEELRQLPRLGGLAEEPHGGREGRPPPRIPEERRPWVEPTSRRLEPGVVVGPEPSDQPERRQRL